MADVRCSILEYEQQAIWIELRQLKYELDETRKKLTEQTSNLIALKSIMQEWDAAEKVKCEKKAKKKAKKKSKEAKRMSGRKAAGSAKSEDSLSKMFK